MTNTHFNRDGSLKTRENNHTLGDFLNRVAKDDWVASWNAKLTLARASWRR